MTGSPQDQTSHAIRAAATAFASGFVTGRRRLGGQAPPLLGHGLPTGSPCHGDKVNNTTILVFPATRL